MNLTDFDPLEKLTLLSPHAIDLRHIPSDYERVTPADIAAKLARTSHGASLLGRVKVAAEYRLIPDLVRCLRTEIIQRRIPWPTAKKTRIRVLAETALTEVIDPKICRKCNGVSQIPEVDGDSNPTGRLSICDQCGGGRYAYTDHARARRCNIHHQEWQRTWIGVYLQVLTIPWTWEGEVRQALR